MAQALDPTGPQKPRAAFDRTLDAVRDDVLRLGALVEDALERAGRALLERDSELADRVRWDDANVNELQRQINTEITTTIATQAPVARDIRELLALYHAAAELERMGDYATSIAKLAQQLASEPETPMLHQIPAFESGNAERWLRRIPAGRVADAHEVAKLALFLASDESSYSSGAEFIIDGGMTAS